MVLSDTTIKKEIKAKRLSINPIAENGLQPASIDLTISDKVWQVAGIPNLANGFSSEFFIKNYVFNALPSELLIKGEATLVVGNTYLAELETSLKLPPNVWGYVNPKSSIGRIDLYTAVLAEGSKHFNVIPEGYEGKLFILIVPQSFPVRNFYQKAFTQLRLFDGPREFLNKPELVERQGKLELIKGKEPSFSEEGLLLHLDLEASPSNLVAFKGGKPLDLGKKYFADPKDYFREKKFDSSNNLFLEVNEFLLAVTQEAFSIGPDICAEMIPYQHEYGEIRSHYAGFFDPGFGFGRNGEDAAAAAVCEIRNLGSTPMFLSHGQTICLFRYERLTEPATNSYGSYVGSHYQSQQGIKLGKYFKSWETQNSLI